ncbi:hypothetical protein ACFWIN_18270 [Streptomyces sp. NPDC127049]|uniref:hypothetical protein n=1 Tax=Streptomyces sp. NPDC127049 TaxID=3347118 RepID=UPI0036556421
MRRDDVTRADGTWLGLALEVPDSRRPGLCVFTAGRRLLIAQESRPVLFALVDEHLDGVDFWRTDAYRSVVPPLRAATARGLAGSSERWAHRYAAALAEAPDGPLHEGRWLLTDDAQVRGGRGASESPALYWSEMIADGHPDGYLGWHLHNCGWEFLPLRPLPPADDGRVKAYRKQVREGTLPPVLVWWVSGFDSFVILDGHARLAAAIAESADPPLLELRRALPREDLAAGTDDAAAFYAYELARFAGLRAVHGPTVPDGAATAGPQLVRLLHDLHTTSRPTWAWPLPGGEARWELLAREATGGREWPGGG